jgi:hypothetical protein
LSTKWDEVLAKDRLERRSSHFAAPRPGIAVGGDLNLTTTLIAQIQAVQKESEALVDPRLGLEATGQTEPDPRLQIEQRQESTVEIIDISGEVVTPTPVA